MTPSQDARTIDIAVTWLETMERSVRQLDYAGCRRIFADDVVAFGTRAAMVQGRDALERDQWRHIWPLIRNFTLETAHLVTGQSGSLLWLACPWTSERQDSAEIWRSRPGRITALLEKRGSSWLAVHTHHSTTPEQTALPPNSATFRSAAADHPER